MKYDLQKSDMWKRISAYIFDKILVFILVVGFAFLLSFVFDFDKYTDMYDERQQYYSELNGVDLSIAEDEYNALPESEKAKFDKAIEDMNNDQNATYAMYMMFNFSLIIVTFSILIAYLALEFAVPLLFRNGQTLGKKIFGIGVMRIDGVKVSPMVLFVRTILGKYTVETMIPVLILIGIGFSLVGIVGVCVAALIVVTNIAMVIATKTRSPIHDLLSNTVTVDMSTQLIFDTPEELLEYKKRIHEESVDKAAY